MPRPRSRPQRHPRRRPRASIRRRILRTSAVVVIVIGLFCVDILIAWAVPLGDFATVEPVPTITVDHPQPALEAQAEAHTCGFHALSTVYKAYGLDPDERRLRARLGVDNVSLTFDSESTGSLHPDMYRVLDQDGFETITLDLDEAPHGVALEDHLGAGRLAVGLIRRQETGVLHWVVLAGDGPGVVRIFDPLDPAPGTARLRPYWDDVLLSVYLVQPRRGEPTAVWRLHARGVKDMVTTVRRDREAPATADDTP